jgi:GMP synthase-like glutamine amidotransferase
MKKKNTAMKVAIIDNSIDPEVYKPVEHWSAFLGVPWEAFRASEGRLPDLAAGFSHVIITGSEASIVEREPWVEEEVRLVGAALSQGFPILGSCYGHQLLALALRGPEKVRRSPRPEIGWIPLRIEHKSTILGEPGTAYAFSSHFDEVIGLDREFRVLASTPGCAVQAFELRRRPVWGIQFHPEIDIPAAREFLVNILGRAPANAVLFEDALRLAPRDSGLIRTIVDGFLAARSANCQG